MRAECGAAHNEPEVFISYRRLDNIAPSGSRGRDGFVNYLLRQVRSKLREDGVPDPILWLDRSQIEPGDIWSDKILNALKRAELFIAILSKNYIRSSWCAKELHTMKERVDMLGAPAGHRRIFRVDKHKVPEHRVPETLQRIQSVQFYREDHDAQKFDEFFWGGKVRYSKEFDNALLQLTSAIGNRLEELLETHFDRQSLPEPQVDVCPSNGHVVFVAKPARDMLEYYRTIVEELRGTGFGVVPDPDEELSGEELRSAVFSALGKAEASIHLLGTRTRGLGMDLVPMQLAAAAAESKRKPGFERLIWAPKVLPAETSDRAKRVRRDPLKILKEFGQRLLETDTIYGDTASNFNGYVLQRLQRTLVSPRQAN
jgi:TIR domain